MASINAQRIKDAHKLAWLAQYPTERQEAIIDFVLGCNHMARLLLRMCDLRRRYDHPMETLEESIAMLEKAVADEFRKRFGHPLFIEQDETGRQRTTGLTSDEGG